MTSFVEADAAIRGAIAAGFSDAAVTYENEAAFHPPHDGSGDFLPYVSVHILEGDSQRIGGGATTSTYRHPGSIKIQIFTPLSDGNTTRSRQIGAALASVLRGKELNGVRVRSASYRGGEIDGPYWRATLDCRFDYDETA